MTTKNITEFYSRTNDGLMKFQIIKKWTYKCRELVLHQGIEGEWAVSDYLTGMLIKENKFKATVKREAEVRISEAVEKGKDLNQFPQVNTDAFIRGWNAIQELLKHDGQFKEGVILAIKSTKL